MSLDETAAPEILPTERTIMNTMPIRTTCQLENTANSSPAPLSTKKSTITGPVHLSSLSISSAEKSHRLQKTVPSIMHTSSDENPTVTGPILNSSIDSATARNTKQTEIESLFEREWKNRSVQWKRRPRPAPRASERTTSTIGFTTTEKTSTVPCSSAFAIPNDTAKMINPTTSSSATTGSSIFVTGPSALYCLTIMSVAAGAVAAAIAPIVTATDIGITSGIRK